MFSGLSDYVCKPLQVPPVSGRIAANQQEWGTRLARHGREGVTLVHRENDCRRPAHVRKKLGRGMPGPVAPVLVVAVFVLGRAYRCRIDDGDVPVHVNALGLTDVVFQPDALTSDNPVSHRVHAANAVLTHVRVNRPFITKACVALNARLVVIGRFIRPAVLGWVVLAIRERVLDPREVVQGARGVVVVFDDTNPPTGCSRDCRFRRS